MTDPGIIGDSVAHFREASEAYLRSLWFPAAHVVLFGLFVKTYADVRRDGIALEAWRPTDYKAANSHADDAAEEDGALKTDGTAADVLDEFVREVGAMGPRGFFVPMTDFSDRIDSIVDGSTSRLHDQSYYFLIVGLAGTLWALVQFTFDPDTAKSITSFLDAMQKAFPISFFGLVLTLGAQVVSHFPEGRVRKGLSLATQRALRFRRTRTEPDVAVLTDAATNIRDAIAPLENLERTLEHAVATVADTFGERLQTTAQAVLGSYSEMRESSESLQETLKQVSGDSAAWAKSVDTLSKAAEQLRSGIQTCNQNIRKQSTALKKLDVQLISTAGVLKTVSERAENLPMSLSEATAAEIAKLAERQVEISSDAGMQLRRSLTDTFAAQVGEITKKFSSLCDKLETVADRCSKTAADASGIVQLAVDAGADRVVGHLRNLNDVLEDKYPGAVSDINDFTTRLAELVKQVDQAGCDIAEHFGEATKYQEALTATHEKLDQLLAKFDRITDSSSRHQNELVSEIRQLRKAVSGRRKPSGRRWYTPWKWFRRSDSEKTE